MSDFEIWANLLTVPKLPDMSMVFLCRHGVTITHTVFMWTDTENCNMYRYAYPNSSRLSRIVIDFNVTAPNITYAWRLHIR